MLLSTEVPTSEITPILAALDDAQTLRRIRDEPGEDTPWRYSSTSGHLTPTSPRHEDMRLDPSLDVTLEGSLNDLPTAVSTEEARKEKARCPRKRHRGPLSRLQLRKPLTLI